LFPFSPVSFTYSFKYNVHCNDRTSLRSARCTLACLLSRSHKSDEPHLGIPNTYANGKHSSSSPPLEGGGSSSCGRGGGGRSPRSVIPPRCKRDRKLLAKRRRWLPPPLPPMSLLLSSLQVSFVCISASPSSATLNKLRLPCALPRRGSRYSQHGFLK